MAKEQGSFKTPFFSVIIPVYNAGQFLSESIASVLGQSYRNFELCLVNDGSTDGSGEICDAAARQHPGQVVAFHQANRGVMCARLLGIQKARGRFLLFLDADDTLRLDALDRLARVVQAQQADFVFFRASRDAKFSDAIWHYPFQDGESFQGLHKGAVYRLACTGVSMNSLGTKAVRRDLFDPSLGCEEYAHVISGEDLLLSLMPLDKAQKLVYLEDMLYHYRPNPAGVTRGRFTLRFFKAISTAGQARLAYARRWDQETPGLLQAAHDHAYLTCQEAVAKALISGEDWQQTRAWLEAMQADSIFCTAVMHGRPSGPIFKRLLMRFSVRGHFGGLWMFWRIYQFVGGKT